MINESQHIQIKHLLSKYINVAIVHVTVKYVYDMREGKKLAPFVSIMDSVILGPRVDLFYASENFSRQSNLSFSNKNVLLVSPFLEMS